LKVHIFGPAWSSSFTNDSYKPVHFIQSLKGLTNEFWTH